jgi:hypothetical protein
MKFVNVLLIPIIIITLISTSCSEKPDIENTSTVRMSNEWFVQYYTDGAAITDFHKILSYNTSDPNSGQVWVDDLNLWPFKAKFDVDYLNLMFKPKTGIKNLALTDDETINVIEGKVLPGAGHSKTGVAVDSIYLKLEFSDDPGTIYELKGHGRTGFFEDEY